MMKVRSLTGNTTIHKALLFALAFIFYGNTLSNDYVLDDVLVITANKFVKKGVSGIWDILSHDSYYGASGKIAKASGGRYRPLAVVSYALEKELFGMKPFVFHFFNVLTYAFICLLVYQFLIAHILAGNAGTAFLCSFLFLIHPVHTEVVANIKSRDELYALLFGLLSLHAFLNYLKSGKTLNFTISLLALFLSLLSKEYAVTYFLVIPLTIYVFSNKNTAAFIKFSLPFWILLGIYIYIRYSINKLAIVEEKDVLNSPYILAGTAEKMATIAWSLFQYLKLFVFPYPLSYDYSYNQVPYVNFSNLQAIFSLIAYSSLTILAAILSYRKNKAGYFIFLYLFMIFIVSNLLINVATPLAERFLLSPGLYLTIALVLLAVQFLKEKNKLITKSLVVLIFLASVPAFAFIQKRNKDWNNNDSLYFTDVKNANNSVRALSFCGMHIVSEIDKTPDSLARAEKLKQAISYFEKAYLIYPDFATMYQNWGLAYYKLNNMDSAEWAWNRLRMLKPDSRFNEPNQDALDRYYFNYYYLLFLEARQENNKEQMLSAYRSAVGHYDKMPDSWLLLGQLYFLNNKKDSAIYAWKKCLSMDPSNTQASGFLKEATR